MVQNPPSRRQVWLRPGVQRAAPEWATLDTALFDVDGVLIDTRRSFRAAVIAGSDHLVRIVNGLTEAPSPLVSPEDVAAFKRAGGFNSDWDTTQAIAALWTARLREWQGQSEADVPLVEWARRASAAARAGHGGLAWLRATVPTTAIPSDETARWVNDELYWGAALVRELFGHEPIFVPDEPGLVHQEEPLLDPAVLPALRAIGITRLGLITGRVGPEVTWALRTLAAAYGLPDEAEYWHDGEFGRSPFGCIVPAAVYAKPDPLALAHAVRALGARAAVYVGDTADDLDLVLRYRREAQRDDATLPPVLAVCVATGEEARVYRERGADVLIPHVSMLPAALAALRADER